MFEYIGEMAKDYIYAVTPLLEDALMDRDLVHRQVNKRHVKKKKRRCFSCFIGIVRWAKKEHLGAHTAPHRKAMMMEHERKRVFLWKVYVLVALLRTRSGWRDVLVGSWLRAAAPADTDQYEKCVLDEKI